MEDNIAIKVTGLGKKYTIGKEKDSSLRSTLAGAFKSSAQKGKDFWALKDVNFEIKKGEVVGIIGKNGAGKSTLLKVLSQITKPTEGRIEINGRVASLLEVGTGFHPELTGRENIYLNGTILGMTRKEVKAKFDEIVEFSGVKQFIDTPVKHYSSGMYVRLAFAVAAHLEPEILIIDEVLAVGDAEFQKKCLGKMEDVAKEGRTVIFVSHDLGAVSVLCNSGILIQNGKTESFKNIDTCITSYLTTNMTNTYEPKKLHINNIAFYKRIELVDSAQTKSNNFTISESISINFYLGLGTEHEGYCVFVTIKDKTGKPVFSIETEKLSEKIQLKINPQQLVRGSYYLETFIHKPRVEQIDRADVICNFNIIDNESNLAKHGDYNYGVVFGKFECHHL